MPSADPAIEVNQKAEHAHLSKETNCVCSSKVGIIAKTAGHQPLLNVLSHYPNKAINLKHTTRKNTETANQNLIDVIKTMLVGISQAKSSCDSYLAYFKFDKLDARPVFPASVRQQASSLTQSAPACQGEAFSWIQRALASELLWQTYSI